ncbi:mechanosensitive ion channel family protein [Sulfurospirillum diekertiae]|uniref:Mechanosensitive ion channel family protein n=1 Tax=Sulfurospirillum diekertiae TaxID=1854492 RepID=A0A6G9VRG3_9BACT|nr:mechanosensitive ion channel family protein [Sulfurospirillum diekertiae]QIR75341.1 mechanosensitive ion channel family protein [Sulfurospirillum diekertiae]QIR77990.1 mechanosensitive ion channel family protein [Sulfurospirillum diekertiae]
MDKELQTLQKFYNIAIEFLTNYSFQLIGALIIVIIGWFAAKYTYTLLMRLFESHHFDMTLSKFVASVVKMLIFAAMIIIALGKVGISIAPFVAAIGAVSLTAGLALQGSVSNYAAGVLLIISRPFKVGDTLSIGNFYGVVEEIKLSYTVLRNEDEELITIPNKKMIGDVLVNSFEFRIVESSIGVTYEEDPTKAIALIKEVLSGFKEVSNTHKPVVGIAKFGDSSIELGLRYWVPTKSYFKTQFEVNLALYNTLHVNNISIPYPQREVRILGEKV